MGWLTDIGNVAVGAIERDREITKEDLIIRAENLKANQEILVKQKDKKYNKELDAYYAEKQKFDDIEKMNKWAADGTVNKDAYAAFALSSTIPNWDTIPKDYKADMIANYDGKTIDYKLSGSAEEINAKAANAMTLINNETAEAIKNAKGNSFLINKILRRKEKAEKDIYSSIENQLKAIDTVNLTEKSTTNSGIDIKQSGDKTALNWTRFKKKNPEWIKQYNALDKEIVFNSVAQKDNFFAFMKASQIAGANTEANFKLKNNDTEIEGITPAAQSLLATYKNVYDEVKKDFSAQALAADGVGITQLRDIMSVAEINKEVQRIINERSIRIETGRGSLQDNMDFVAVVPLTVLDKANEILVSGQGISKGGKGKWKPDIDTIKSLYEEFLKKERVAVEGKYKKNKEFNSYNNIQSSIENEGEMKDKFLAFVSDKVGVSVPSDDPNTPEIESITKAPKVLADEKMGNEDMWAKKPAKIRDSVVKLEKGPDGKVRQVMQTKGVWKGIKVMKDGKGFQQKQPNGNFKPIYWEDIKKYNQADSLPPYLKLKYDAWLAGNVEQAGKSNITESKQEEESLPNKIFIP